MVGVLDGIRVVEFSAVLQGPLAGLILTQLGAEVIRIEDPVGKDRNRYAWLNIGKDQVHISDINNRNKRGITIDLANEKGREIVYRLIAKSDVFLSNYLPKSLKELGLDYETLSKYNPKLVYATSSGYGKKGPESNERSFDNLAIARSGLMMAAGESDAPPGEIKGFIGDCLAGTFLAFSAITGLLTRERLGIGQEISTSLLGPLVWVQMVHATQYLLEGRLVEQPFTRQSRTNVPNPLSNNYLCKDGKWLKLAAVQSDSAWPEFCHLVGIESLEKDPRFENSRGRQDNNEELIRILDNAFSTKPRDEWLALLKDQKVAGFLCVAIKEVSELINDLQVIANNYIVEDEHPTLGHIRTVQFPMEFSKTPLILGGKGAPQLGEYNEELLLGLGYTQGEIADLKNEKVI